MSDASVVSLIFTCLIYKYLIIYIYVIFTCLVSCQIFRKNLFAKMTNGWNSETIFAKSSIILTDMVLYSKEKNFRNNSIHKKSKKYIGLFSLLFTWPIKISLFHYSGLFGTLSQIWEGSFCEKKAILLKTPHKIIFGKVLNTFLGI